MLPSHSKLLHTVIVLISLPGLAHAAGQQQETDPLVIVNSLMTTGAPGLALHYIDVHQDAGGDIASRVEFIEADVRNITEPKVDVINAFNFSYCIFETRDEMRKYFEVTREGLKDDGVLVLDLFGGTEAMDVLEEETELEDFEATYRWEHVSFNPINNHMECAIHFDFDDGSSMEGAFTYAWRLWSIPEIKELLEEAGYSKVRIYWEEYVDSDDDDDELEGTGEYYETDEVENQESWMIYIVAEK